MYKKTVLTVQINIIWSAHKNLGSVCSYLGRGLRIGTDGIDWVMGFGLGLDNLVSLNQVNYV